MNCKLNLVHEQRVLALIFDILTLLTVSHLNFSFATLTGH